jgi:hypothetical protein
MTSINTSSYTYVGVKNCGECPKEKTCIVENSASIGGGVKNLDIKFCNYDKAKFYDLELSLKSIPACDEEKQTIPRIKSLEPTDSCIPDACVVKATFESPIDWAIGLKSGEPNILSAKIKDTPENPVHVGIFPDVAGAELKPIEIDFSVCQTSFPVQGWRFSIVNKCNVVTLCRGNDGDTSCKIPIKYGLLLSEVACLNDECKGYIMSQSCSSANPNERSLISQIKVADSIPSKFVKIGNVIAPNSTISRIDGLLVGSTQIEVSVSDGCLGEDIQLYIHNKDSGSVLAVSSVEVFNTSMIATLSSGLNEKLAGKKLKLQIKQCGILSEPLEVQVKSPNQSNLVNSNEGSAIMKANTNPPTGLSGGWIIGGIIIGLAVCGFIAEHWYHQRHNHTPTHLQSNAIALMSPPS